MNRAKAGIGAILATVLLISLAITGSSVLYTYVLNTTSALEQPNVNYSILEIPSGSASNFSITFYVLNLGKGQVTLDGSEKVYVTTPRQINYEFSQVAIAGNQVTFKYNSTASNATFQLLPEQTLAFVVDTPFVTVPGYVYSIVLVLGDGTQVVTTIEAS